MRTRSESSTLQRLLTLTAAAGLGLSVAACGGNSGTTTTSAPAPTTSTGQAPATTAAESASTVAGSPTSAATTDALRSLLLAASDLPTDWTITYSQPGDEFGSFGDSSCPGHAVEPAIVDRVRPTVSASFGTADDVLAFEQAAFQSDPVQMEADLAAVFAVDAACFGMESMEGEGGKTVFERLVMPELADQQESATWRFLAEPDYAATAVGHIAIVRVGSIAMEISQSEVLRDPGASPTYTEEEFIALVQKAVAKVRP